jgi:hypothetical protein
MKENHNEIYIYDSYYGFRLAIQISMSVHFMNICLMMIQLDQNM